MAELPRNFLLTGLPRAGTTLLAWLFEQMPDAVALHEPLWQFEWAKANRPHTAAADFAHWLVGDVQEARRKLLAGEPVLDRRREDGTPVSNYFRAVHTRREIQKGTGMVPFTRAGLTKKFTLAVKHNALYLSVLPELAAEQALPIIAIVRHPIGVLASWRSTPVPVSRGQLPAGILYWQEMAQLVAQPMELLEKQVRMYDLMCKRLHECSGSVHVLMYEALAENPALLASFTGKRPAAPSGFVQKRELDFYGADTEAIANMIKRVGRHYRHFYPELETA